jgi:hypothetical protein
VGEDGWRSPCRLSIITAFSSMRLGRLIADTRPLSRYLIGKPPLNRYPEIRSAFVQFCSSPNEWMSRVRGQDASAA